METDVEGAFARLVEVIALLREHCPWMGALTHESLVQYLIEESYELVEAIEAGDGAELRAELGDVLLQVVLHARLAEERGAFTVTDVARGLTAKMVRRNQHVFRPDGSLRDSFPATVEDIVRAWDTVKRAEKPERGTPFDGIPAALPALRLAAQSLERAERAGTPGRGSLNDVPTGPGAPGPVSPDPAGIGTEAELGELLFGVVRFARANGMDAERALRAAVANYQRSFE